MGLDDLVRLLELGLAHRDVAHFAEALNAREDQEDVLEYHPSGVLHPAPSTGLQNAINRLRCVDSAKEVVAGDDYGCGDEDPPVAIEREDGERAKDMEMRLDPASGKVDQ